MSKKIFFICAMFALLLTGYKSEAGFAIRKHVTKTETVAITTQARTVNTAKEQRRQQFRALKDMLLIRHEGDKPKERKISENGWEGTTAMWCGIGGLVWMPPALILAVIFGALGIGKGHKHQGRAIAGLAIGLFGIFMWAFLIVLLAA